MEPRNEQTLKQFVQEKIQSDMERRKQRATSEELAHFEFIERWVAGSIADEIIASDEFNALTESLVKRYVGEAEQDMLVGRGVRQPEDYDTINVINLTPHEVNLYQEDGEEMIAAIPRSSRCVRVTNTPSIVRRANLRLEDGTIVENIPFVHNKRLAGDELPPPKPGTFYIVSALVLEVNPYREDLICVNTSNEQLGVIRNNGTIVGSRSLRPSPRGLYAHLAV